MTVAELRHRMGAGEFDDWSDYFEAHAEYERLVQNKVKPPMAAEMVWMGPEQRAAAAAAEDSDGDGESD
jgi:hypothetical protein